jgi:predicted flavoprotein YhiN
VTPKQFLSNNPHFCVSALKRYTQHDFIKRVSERGIAFHEKTLGQLFCDGSATQIIDMLLEDLKAVGGELRLGVEPGAVEHVGDGWRVATSLGAIECRSLVMATGGLSIPKMGSTGYAYDVARQFGLKIVEPRPALVPFMFNEPQLAPIAELAGVSVEARASAGDKSFDEGMLFTHRGLSGPAILQISSYWRDGEDVVIDLARGRDVLAELKAARVERPKQQLDNALAAFAPKRLADQVAARTFGTARLADLSDAKLREVARSAECVAGEARWDGRLAHGGGDAGRRGHGRPVVEDDGGEGRTRALFHRRVRRRDRLARGLQFPVGVEFRLGRRTNRLGRDQLASSTRRESISMRAAASVSRVAARFSRLRMRSSSALAPTPAA